MMGAFSLKGKNILITGASSGIGRQCAITCSEMGANVILIARDVQRLNETMARLSTGNHSIYNLDITEYGKIEPLIVSIANSYEKIDGFIHSAGIELTLPLRNNKEEIYQKVFSVNVLSGFEFAKVLSHKKYLPEQGASFVFLSSIMGLLGEAGKVAYCSSKGAVIAGVRALAIELASKKIRVNSISPAMVETEMATELFSKISEESKNEILKLHPLGIGKPEDVSWACIYLLSEASRWVTGTNLIIDGGYSAK
ncbi:MAG TPA: SDR family oxidoreductase [Cytophagaceae bacterium]|jgi:NAD(P)-dependent dehydrogenase (short-subunit alcohol dehydrogenase family)|nr:SDR family oxidoreductase [Cytophagaceae bacterium]